MPNVLLAVLADLAVELCVGSVHLAIALSKLLCRINCWSK